MRTRTLTLLLSLLLATSLAGCGHGRALRQAHEAQADLAEGRLDEGRAGLLRALALDPELRGIHTALGLLALTAGDTALAEQELDRELQRHPNDEAARVNLALSLLKSGRPEEALSRLGPAADSDDPKHHTVRALTLLHLGRLDEARAALDRMGPGGGPAAPDSVTPNGAPAVPDRAAPDGGAAAPDAADPGRAPEAPEEAAPGHAPFTAYVAGLVAAHQGRIDDAVAAFQKATRQDPTAPAPRVALGLVRLGAGQASQGAAEAVAAVKALPEQAELRLVAGLLLLDAGDARAAREQLERAVALAPDRAGVRLALAAAAALAGDDAEAVRHLDEELARHPGLAVAHKNRGILLFRKGDLTGARAAFERAAELAPNDTESREAALAIARLTP